MYLKKILHLSNNSHIVLIHFIICGKLNPMLLQVSKSMLVLAMIAFLVIGFWSLLAMSMDMTGKMINCPFIQDSASLCQMNIFEHINAWQQFSTFVQQKNLLVSLFSLLVLFTVGLLIQRERQENTQSQKFRHYFYRYEPEIKLFNPLALAFARGIINPKVYA